MLCLPKRTVELSMVCENVNDAENPTIVDCDALLETSCCTEQGPYYIYFFSVPDASSPKNGH